MDTKRCKVCEADLPGGQFYNDPQTADKLTRDCKECRRKYKNQWRADYKTRNGERDGARYDRDHLKESADRKAQRVKDLAEWVNEMKSQPCMDCGGTFPPVCMDYDHVRGEKRRSVTRMIHELYSRASILEEIAKCDLVCSNCHRIRTWMTGREMPWYDKIRKHART
jgi:hypothetical protein